MYKFDEIYKMFHLAFVSKIFRDSQEFLRKRTVLQMGSATTSNVFVLKL